MPYNGGVLIDQPAIGCRTLPDDEDDEDEEKEGEADAEVDGDLEGLGGTGLSEGHHLVTGSAHTHGTRSALAHACAWEGSGAPSSLVIKPTWPLQPTSVWLTSKAFGTLQSMWASELWGSLRYQHVCFCVPD